MSTTPEGAGAEWGSDQVAALLRALGIRYISLVPGSSYRGLHDSLVNYLGNSAPEIVLAITEEAAVAIAHGYAKVTGRGMAAAVHANVGLMRAVMAVYNAWCDRTPLLLLGATGPWDAARRRPWIDWIHTSADQGALVREFTKWDGQPASAGAAVEAVLRAWQIAHTAPHGPVYVNLDSGLQEARLAEPVRVPDVRAFAPPPEPVADLAQVATAAALLGGARRPVILAGRCSRSPDAWHARVALAERLGAPVATTLRVAAAFPTDHPLHAAPPELMLAREAEALLTDADVVLSLDWPDLGGTLRQAQRGDGAERKVIQVSCDAHNHRGWAMDGGALPPVDVHLFCPPDAGVPLMLEALGGQPARPRLAAIERAPGPALQGALSLRNVADALASATGDVDVCYTRLPLGWSSAQVHFRHPLDFLGGDGGGGLGSGPGMAVGAGLALKGSGRVPIAVLGDGDFLMGHEAIWTAAHSRVPLLVVVCNNKSFDSDERHQEWIAMRRRRPTARSGIGERLADPDIDIVALARAMGAVALGPARDPAGLREAIGHGLAAARDAEVVVVDVRVGRR